MTLAQPIKRYTPQEYYDLERAAEYKSDFYAGEIFAMAGGSVRHSLICTNLLREVGNRLKGTPCVAYESNLRLKNKVTGLRNYPDASVFCGPLEYDEEDPYTETVTNPTVLFEVLSRSTEAYDRGFKAEQYRRIPSLRAHVLVSQKEPHVEIFFRQPAGPWLFQEESGMTATLTIPAIGIELPLAEIYTGVDFRLDEPGFGIPAR